jgi:hypothetical protein
VAGYSIGGNNRLRIVSRTGRKPLQIPTQLECRKELLEWVKVRFDNLDVLQQQQETQDILTNETFGQTDR